MISQEILTKYPDIFYDQISRVSLQDLTYEKFASVARKLIEKHPGGWTRIALVCYFARELALEDESTDYQLDNLVSFSSRFISETSAEWIASQGGWVRFICLILSSNVPKCALLYSFTLSNARGFYSSRRESCTRAVRRSIGAGAPAYVAGAGVG